MAVQISAYIEDDIKEKMEKYSAANGLKKGFLIQNASYISVDEKTFEAFVDGETKANVKLNNLLKYD